MGALGHGLRLRTGVVPSSPFPPICPRDLSFVVLMKLGPENSFGLI